MKAIMFSGAALIAAAVAYAAAGAQLHSGPQTVPSLVFLELYTSEGCSSCPPADALFSKLIAGPLAGIEVIPLAWHVDYWNKLGWTDALSSAGATERQSAYAAKHGQTGIYTPQMMVNGRVGFVGSEAARAASELAKAAKSPLARLSLAWSGEPGAPSLSIRFPASFSPSAGFDVFVAATEDGIVRPIGSGENSGRTLRHDAVVRERWTASREISGEWKAGLPAGAAKPRLRFVAWMEDRASGAILAAGAIASPAS